MTVTIGHGAVEAIFRVTLPRILLHMIFVELSLV